MEEFKSYKLSDVANLSTGFPFHGSKYSKTGIRVVRGDNVTIGSLRWDSDKLKCWSEPFSRAAEYSLQDGDIVIGMDGSRVGRNRAQVTLSDLPLLLAQRVACIRHNEKSVQDFLYYLIFSERFVDYVKLVQTGTSIPHISLKQIGDFEVKLPSIEKQKSICRILKSLDDKIALNNRINHNLEEQAQALYKSWFVDFEPFKDGEFMDSELGMIPEGWQVKNLLEVASLYDSKRKPLSGNERFQMDKIYPYYGATSVMDYVDDYIFDGTYLLMGEDGSVMTEDGFPFLQYVTGKFWPNNHAHVMQGCSGFSTEMLHCALLRKVIKSSVTGAVQAKISQANMKKIQFAYPPKGVLTAFDNLLQKTYSQMRIITSQNAYLSIVRDNLLPRLMSGQRGF